MGFSRKPLALRRILEVGLGLVVPWQTGAAQTAARRALPSRDSVTVVAGERYRSGFIGRLLLGGTYRDLWGAPIKVAVLDLRRFAGGLTPTKTGGGNQTRSLRFMGRDGNEYVFRLVDKDKLELPRGFEGTVLQQIARDQVSAHHPGGAVAADPLLSAAGILHPKPALAVMPDDPLLGEFRAGFAGTLGMIETYPTKPDDAPGFAGAIEIVDSDELRKMLNTDPGLAIDTRAYVAARLMDCFLNDWDRHPGNWKWALVRTGAGERWVPIARDRDKVFISYGGLVGVAGKVAPNLITFGEDYPPIRGLSWNSHQLDRRILSGLEREAWDSVAGELRRKLTDRVIESAVAAMPTEYRKRETDLAATLKRRRDALPEIAGRLYRLLSAGPDIHGTDSADIAAVVRAADGSVDVELRSTDGEPWFHRRFFPGETDEVRIYLHGGDDRAVVRGSASTSLPVRIIGGNGENQLIDSSRVGGRTGQARFYDQGRVTDAWYGPDTTLDRRPWLNVRGHSVPPGRDRGAKFAPLIGFSAPGDIGLVVRFGVQQTRYGFRVRPHAGATALTAEYATGLGAWRLTALADRRSEGTRFHLTGRVRMSEFEVTSFHGLGNATTSGPAELFQVDQRQWLVEPALAFALDNRSDITLGPVIQYSTTNSDAGTFVGRTRPYGSGDFGQAGVRVAVRIDRRDQAREPHGGILFDAGGTWYPAVWDVREPFGAVDVAVAGYRTLPLPLRPILVVKGSARKLSGPFPFHEAAFIGGRGSVRSLDRQRYAGDASVGGTTELQVPLGRLPLVLPFVFGVYGFADVGRVYVDGTSPDGWHADRGVGFWVGILSPSTSLSAELDGGFGRSLVRVRAGLSF